MRLGKTLGLTLLLFPLIACGGSRSVEVERPAPAPSLTLPCAAPVSLPDRGLTQGEVEVFWGRDRSALRSCGGRHGGLVEWVHIR